MLLLRPNEDCLRQFEDTNVRSWQIPFAAGDRVERTDLAIAIPAVGASLVLPVEHLALGELLERS